MKIDLKTVPNDCCIININTYLNPNPNATDKIKFRRSMISITKLKGPPETNALATEKVSAKIIITNTSFTTVTPIEVCVKGPFALISVITAIVEASDGAIKIVAANNANANFTLGSEPSKNGI